MSTVFPSEFLFVADPGAGQVRAFKINADGGLSAVPGSPFPAADSPRLLSAAGNNLLVAGRSTLAAFAVDKKTGAVSENDVLALPSISDLLVDPSSAMVFAATANGQFAIRVANNKLQIAHGSQPTRGPSTGDAVIMHQAALDATGRFFYVLDSSKGEISAFRVQNGKPIPLSPPSYPAGRGASSITVAMP